jgi:hypothetical protein
VGDVFARGALKYCYNFFGIEYYYVTADEPIPAGEHQARMEFAYDGGGGASIWHVVRRWHASNFDRQAVSNRRETPDWESR